jgi:hypothetical protein
MDWHSAQGRLNHALVQGNISFSVASAADDAEIRRLLREVATDGWIRISLEREPDAFAAPLRGARHDFIIARERDRGEVVGVCEQSLHRAFVDQRPAALPYLGGLRVARKYRNRIGILKGGFRAVRHFLHDPSALPYALTAIAAENKTALRVLGAGLPGMPAYQPLQHFSTLAMRPSRRFKADIRCEFATSHDLPAIAVHLQRCYQKLQFAPQWTTTSLAACRDLAAGDFIVVRRGPGIAACVALWNQQRFKQTIVRGYCGLLGRVRPAVNLLTPLLGMPRLPRSGEHLGEVFLSHLAVDGDDDAGLFAALIDTALAAARRRSFGVALLGLAARHPLAAVALERYRPRQYRSLLHLVHWDRGDVCTATADAPMPHVEIAML